MLLAMAVTFAAIASLAAVGGNWAVEANQYGRIAAIVLLGFFGLILLFPSLSDRATAPLVALGARLSQTAEGSGQTGGSIAGSLLLGVATGLLWAPCAGPILGLILTGAALHGANVQTSLLLAAYAAGAATSLALALLVGGRVFAAAKGSLGAKRSSDTPGSRRRGAESRWLPSRSGLIPVSDAGLERQHDRAGATPAR